MRGVIFIGATVAIFATSLFFIHKRNVTFDNNSDSVISGSEKSINTGIIAENLQVPWSLAFLPDGGALFTERPGRVRFISPDWVLDESPALSVKDVKTIGEGGLLGIAIHPQFQKNFFVYLYYTYSGTQRQTLNKIVRYIYRNKVLLEDRVILSDIPGNANHNGGRIAFGPDGYLYVTTGDSQDPSLSQDTKSLAGKILRIDSDGKPAPDNPFSNHVYSFGHRNPQGLAWDSTGRLWSTEHGSSAGDELNLIVMGSNYGWPVITRNQSKVGMVTPVINSGGQTWAPSGITYQAPYLYFAGLRSSSLYRYHTESGVLSSHLRGQYGRIRDVIQDDSGFLYLLTSNMDGRSLSHLDGDKIIRVDPSALK